MQRVFSYADKYCSTVVYLHLTARTFFTAATMSCVCGRAAASNVTAYGIGTSTPRERRKATVVSAIERPWSEEGLLTGDSNDRRV